MQTKISIGKILKPHGVKGDFVFYSYSGDFSSKIYDHLYLLVRSEYQQIFLDKEKLYEKNKFLLHIKEYDRTIIEKIKGDEIFVDDLPYSSLKDNEFFYRDLYDMEVFYSENLLGKIIHVHNFSGPEVVEIFYTEKNKNIFLPLQKPFLKELDLKEKKIFFEEIDAYL